MKINYSYKYEDINVCYMKVTKNVVLWAIFLHCLMLNRINMTSNAPTDSFYMLKSLELWRPNDMVHIYSTGFCVFHEGIFKSVPNCWAPWKLSWKLQPVWHLKKMFFFFYFLPTAFL